MTFLLSLVLSFVWAFQPAGSVFINDRLQSDTITTTLKSWVAELQLSPEKYILWLHCRRSQLKWNLRDEEITLGELRMQVWFSHENFSRFTWDTSYRFTQPFHIIFGSYYVADQWNTVYGNFLDYLMSPFTVMSLFGFDSTHLLLPHFGLKWMSELYFPALQILILRSGLALVCTEYCKNISWNVTTIFRNPVKFHRLHFRVGNRPEIPALHVPRMPGYYLEEEFGNDRYACSKLLLTHQKMYYCDTFLMTIIYMAEVHNISFKILSNRIVSEDVQFTRSRFQKILAYATRVSFELADVRTGMHYAFDNAFFLFYCKSEYSEKPFLDAELWTSGFSWDSWCLILVSTIMFAIFLAELNYSFRSSGAVMEQLWQVFCMYVGQISTTAIKTPVIYTGVVFLTMLVINLYGNSITSAITVMLPPAAYDTIKDLLNGGHKIMWFSRNQIGNTTPEDEYGEALAIKGLEASEAFITFHMKPTLRMLTALLRLPTAHVMSEFTQGLDAAYYKKNVINKPYIYKCRNVKERLLVQHLFWVMETVNRNWLMETIQMIDQSGLRDQITQWVDWAYNLSAKTLDVMTDSGNKPVPEADVIGLKKLLLPFVVCAVVHCTALLVFLIEIKVDVCKLIKIFMKGVKMLSVNCGKCSAQVGSDKVDEYL